MRINEATAIVGRTLRLVPYAAHHVERYHEWMQDEVLRAATASEPLTLDEEYQMQACAALMCSNVCARARTRACVGCPRRIVSYRPGGWRREAGCGAEELADRFRQAHLHHSERTERLSTHAVRYGRPTESLRRMGWRGGGGGAPD